MQHSQALDHTNRLSKHACKHIGKFDEGNCTILYQNIHSSDWVIEKVHLHNTKIVTSKTNEDEAYSKSRTKNYHKGCDACHFEIRKIIFEHPKVFTKFQFIDLSTITFEFRLTNKIQMSVKG